METAIAKSLKQVIDKVNSAIKNSTKTSRCTIVGASKTKPLELLQQAYDAGLRHFGENYVDEIVTKAPKLPQDIKWHYIGHLQTNKIKQVLVPNLYMLETIDSIKLATKVNKECQKLSKKLKVLIQVKTSTEDTKSGVSTEDAPALVEFIMTQCPNLEFSGLMTIGYEGDENAFIQLYDLKIEICEKFKLNKDEIELSMGMSQDFEKAILYGSTNVRIGTTIFGAREYPMKAQCKEEHIDVAETKQNEQQSQKKETETQQEGKKSE
ncbi:pyridoxal phosphate enzyme, YggS family protein (macronuclear) [Tetrahymena thermophila SB210]|uniref:Pyridoxal phosphate homeostasis protein n=1 Tax=Tetrahymena thermophila (strain SB210) TaxID=312017 RepID=I7MLA5_TETTS|nr:pyridoxal phosphate enzyme, YggS family protein [Tetrahymena thermophila SB210]EAS01475.2 pyridoxal phosphate enzyme, YggS family protein [Tetrahymena thermophila SB210]|eukprot:XP_001021721.2 pyridoxal phosphate enzyme, YggS family protein [Tetrahymena thermophila SB210]